MKERKMEGRKEGRGGRELWSESKGRKGEKR